MRRSTELEDEQRFDALFAAEARAVLGYALRRVAEPEDAADVVAETFAVAWRRLEDVPEEPRPWLYGVARRVLANQRRGGIRRERLAGRLREELRISCPLGDEPDETAAVVRAALARLPEREREVLLLTLWEELTPTEIARVCGVPVVTVRTRLHRARRRLRVDLEAAGFREGGVSAAAPRALPVKPGGSC